MEEHADCRVASRAGGLDPESRGARLSGEDLGGRKSGVWCVKRL